MPVPVTLARYTVAVVEPLLTIVREFGPFTVQGSGVGVAFGVGDGLTVAVGEGFAVGVGDGLVVAVGDGFAVAVGLAPAVGDGLAPGGGDADGELPAMGDAPGSGKTGPPEPVVVTGGSCWS